MQMMAQVQTNKAACAALSGDCGCRFRADTAFFRQAGTASFTELRIR